MFAIKRRDKVNGRMRILTSSIKTRSGLRPRGLPLGSKVLRKSLKFSTTLLRRGPKKKGKANRKTNIGLTVTLEWKGINPNQLRKNKPQNKYESLEKGTNFI